MVYFLLQFRICMLFGQVQPMLKVLQEQAPKLGDAKTLIADTGYC